MRTRGTVVVAVVGVLLLSGLLVAVGPLLLDVVRAWWSGGAASVAMRVEPATSAPLPAASAAASPAATPSAKRELYRRFQTEPAVLASARREADAVRAQLERTLAARADAGQPRREEPAAREAEFPTAPAASSNDPVAQARRRALQRTVKEEFIPLAVSCYQTLLAKRPDAAGKLVLNMTIVGDRAIGGVVESVEIAPASTLKDEELTTCIRESMLAVQFDPPPTDGGRVTITYPFDFAP